MTTGATAQGAGMFDALLPPDLAPPHLLGLESYLLEAVAARACAPALLVYALSPRTVSLGRYHLYGGADQHGGVNGVRRMTGGRVVGAGAGRGGRAHGGGRAARRGVQVHHDPPHRRVGADIDL